MTRIRVVFVLLALVLLVSLALVVDKALDSVAAEGAMRHRALADRIIDEMEGELTTWLRREEDRPFAQYRYFFVPEGSPTQIVNLTRSPLSQLPREPFVVCYFQIDPDGTVSSPLWPDNEELAAVAAGWTPSAGLRSVVDLVSEAVSSFWSTETGVSQALMPGRRRRSADQTEPLAQVVRSKKALLKTARKEPPAPKEKAEDSLTYLSRLNRGASSRSQRPTKVASSQAWTSR